ncbi:transposase [Actinacidiphila oryziradicis]|uniref:transposase n=1 Tax=Actinacidiphila oryziradicis TaxID=2571141 RepID=UPI001FE38AEA|nr:transposase [Actinacidiphila oryziradicis]
MSLNPVPAPEIPEVTVRVARGAFPKGCLAMRVRDELGVLFQDTDFAAVFPTRGGPGLAPGMLAVVSVMQFAERLTDRQAADAVRGRIDWKYLLGMELENEGFHFSVLSGFRERLVGHGQEQVVLDRLLARLSELGFLRVGGRVRTDATHVLALVRDVNRLELCTETLRCALEALAVAAADWLRGAGIADASWQDRYGQRADSYRLPKGEQERGAFAVQVGSDGFALMETVHHPGAPNWLRQLPTVQVLRRAWIQQYHRDSGGTAGGALAGGQGPPAGQSAAGQPARPRRTLRRQARHGLGRLQGPLSETCEKDRPHLIVNVATTPAPVDDSRLVEQVHQQLQRRGAKPDEHLVDGGYTSAAIILTARTQGIDLVGPLPAASDRQSRAKEGFALTDFQIHWEEQYAVCSTGAKSRYWGNTHMDGRPRTVVIFPEWDCRTCKVRTSCTHQRLHPPPDPAPTRGTRTPPTPTRRAGHRLPAAA